MKISKDLYMRISDKTGTDYEGIVLGDDLFYVEPEVIENMFKDMFCEIDGLEERIEKLEKPREFDEHSAWQDQCLEEE